MRILFLCNKLPYPPNEGGSMAMNMMIEGFIKAGHEVKVLAVSSNKYTFNPSEVPEDYKNQTQLETVFIDLKLRIFPAIYCFLRRKSYHVHRFISKEFEAKLEQILKAQNFDIVQIETIFLTPYLKQIRELSHAKVFLRAHNIEHLIWKRLSENTKNPFKSIYLDHLSVQLKNYEIDHLEKYDGIICISKVDEKYYSNFTKEPMITATFGLDLKHYKPHQKAEPLNSLSFIGALNWMPNEEGLKWFLKEIWPSIHDKFPSLKFYIASKEIPKWLTDSATEKVELVSDLQHAKDFITSKSIMVVPLKSGSGIRIKIIEGMALEKAIISTTIGAEGINYTDGENILIADRKEEFLAQISLCMDDQNFIKSIGKKARKTAEEDHNADKIIKDLVSFYQNKQEDK